MAKKKNWIEQALGKNKGALHRSLGVPEGRTIPKGKLKSVAAGTGPLSKRAKLALTLQGFHK